MYNNRSKNISLMGLGREGRKKGAVFTSKIEVPVLLTPNALFLNTLNRMKCRIMTGGKGINSFPRKHSRGKWGQKSEEEK